MTPHTTKNIAVVVYDNNRSNLIEWTYFNRENLRWHKLIANDATAGIIGGTLNVPVAALPEDRFGSYTEITRMIENGEIDILLCIGDPSQSNPGIESLIRVATVNQVIIAPNQASAGLILTLLQQSVRAAASTSDRMLPGINHVPGAYVIN